MTTIEKVKDLNSISIEFFINSLTYELTLESKVEEEKNIRAKRSMALKTYQE